tara:strand:- start:307 stop:609 length:303 start_codon:yes stop_codon:yes gene_type:complete
LRSWLLAQGFNSILEPQEMVHRLNFDGDCGEIVWVAKVSNSQHGMSNISSVDISTFNLLWLANAGDRWVSGAPHVASGTSDSSHVPSLTNISLPRALDMR